METTYKLSKQSQQNLKIVAQAKSTDKTRPVLCAYHFTPERIETTDGFNLHMIARNSVPELSELPAGLYFIDKIADIIELVPCEGKFPETDHIVPEGPATFKIAINATMLKHLVNEASGFIEFYFDSNEKPIEARTQAKECKGKPSTYDSLTIEPAYMQAVIMPGHWSNIQDERKGAIKPIMKGRN